jgi:transaldolase
MNCVGLMDGVMTNPSLILKSGGFIVAGPVSAEVAPPNKDMMCEVAVLATIADDNCIKAPLTLDGLKACKLIRLAGHQANVTPCFLANQALLAAKAGASFISPIVGRVDDTGADAWISWTKICWRIG